MSDKSVAQKLLMKEGCRALIVSPPPGYASVLGPLPDGATVTSQPDGPVDLIQVFVGNRKGLEEQLAGLKPLLAPKTIFWVTYYKGTAKVKTDINRDSINAYAATLGLQGVAMISVDDDWAALRLRLTG